MHQPRIGFGMSQYIFTSPVNDCNHLPSLLVDRSLIAGREASQPIPRPVALAVNTEPKEIPHLGVNYFLDE